jgi:intracellular sulfur oxidation DsrE/DsrF family protein
MEEQQMTTQKRLVQGCLLTVLIIGLLVPVCAEQSENTWDKVVFHVDDTRTARWALMLARSYLDDVPTAKIVFVAYGPGVDFLLEDAMDRHDNPYDYVIQGLTERGVDFRVCAATLAAREINKKNVLKEVKIVPSGISEIARLQVKEGFAYLKP